MRNYIFLHTDTLKRLKNPFDICKWALLTDAAVLTQAFLNPVPLNPERFAHSQNVHTTKREVNCRYRLNEKENQNYPTSI